MAESYGKHGGGWLLQPPDEIATPEDFDETTVMIAEATRAFVAHDVAPLLDRMEHGEVELNRPLLRKAGELGLLGIETPERFGGLDLPKSVSTVVAQELAGAGGFATTYGAHTSIGMLPIVYFGTPAQQERYLPALVSGERCAAYALTEPGSGSDALAAKTRADLSADGSTYVLNGSKMWISNAGIADLFIVFAKVGGEAFTGFIVERDTPGLTLGAEERKMGIKSSSTRSVSFENAPVPVENVLGEVGRGHKIAFSALNVGRYKLGAGAVGAAIGALGLTTVYAKERHQFGRPIASFGLMQQKLAQMATRIFVTESSVYRTLGRIDAALEGCEGAAALAGIEEYAIESSIIKVLGSETLDFCVDEGVQIHGGLGYSGEMPIERAYRDSRIGRIYEGTNEINRLLIPGMLLKRAAAGRLPLLAASATPLDRRRDGPDDREIAKVADLKRLVLLVAGAATRRFGPKLDEEQEVLAAVADVVIAVYSAESGLLRARRLGIEPYLAMARLALARACSESESGIANVLPRLAQDDELRALLKALRRFAEHEPIDTVALGRSIADAVIEQNGYPRPRVRLEAGNVRA